MTDRYEIERPLAPDRDGLFVARDRSLDRRVVLQVIPGDDAARTVRDARAASRLLHPNVIAVYDARLAADGSAHIAMELVDGIPLDRWLREHAGDAAAIAAVFASAGRGLAAAHAAGLALRDLRVDRILVGDDGRARVGDLRPGYEADAMQDRRRFCAAVASALGSAAPPLDEHMSMEALVAALQPPPRRRRRLAWAAAALFAVAAAIAWAVVARDRDRASGPTPPMTSAPMPYTLATPTPARAGFTCGPWLQTYAVPDGVRCVLFAQDPDGTPWIAWYGEGVDGDVRYRHLGEGRVGGDGIVAVLDGDSHTVRIAASAAGPRPPRIVLDGAWHETWVRTAGVHSGYRSAFTEPVRTCGPSLASYRGFRALQGFAGWSVRCRLPGGRTWLGAGVWNVQPHLHIGTSTFDEGQWKIVSADLCDDPRAACGRTLPGDLALVDRRLGGIELVDVTGAWPELWMRER